MEALVLYKLLQLWTFDRQVSEPNLQMMLEGLREREKRERALTDKRDVCEDEIECEEETAMEKEPQGDDIEPEESICVPETQMKITQKPVGTIGKEDNEEFIPVLSKISQKRARQKEKCNSKSEESNGSGDTVNSTSTSHSRKEERRGESREKIQESRRCRVDGGRQVPKNPCLMYKIEAWNIRGMNNPYKKSEVLCWIKKYKLDMVALLEVKLQENKWAEAVTRCSPDDSWKAEFSTIDGGWARILLFWNRATIKINNVVKNYYFMFCKVEAENKRFGLIVVYASNNQRERKQMWEEIEKAGDKFNGCWICMGDFNCVTDQKDKLNGNRVRDTDTVDFRKFLAITGMQDLPSSGYHYTWSNNHVNPADRIWCKLDRALGNDLWFEEMEGVQANFLPPTISDHSPVIVYWGEEKRIFKILGTDFVGRTRGMDKRVNMTREALMEAPSNSESNPTDNNDIIKHELSVYFKELLGQARVCSPIDSEEVAQGPVVTGEQCRSLVRGVTDKEIWSVLNCIGADKAPGLDGFSSSFFKRNWSTIGKELCEGVRHCLR
ncbi:hypothetical protein QQ045_020769 [Rhodiola kirilowii]